MRTSGIVVQFVVGLAATWGMAVVGTPRLSAQTPAADADSVSADGQLDYATVATLLQRAKQARDANAERLQSAFGTGRVTYRVHEVGDDPIVVMDSDIQFFFDRPKYRVHLVHNIRMQENVRPRGQENEDFVRWTPVATTEQIILYDRDVLTSIEFEGKQAKGELYFGFARLAVMRAAGFPFEDPVTLWTQAVNLDMIDPGELKVIPLDGGGFVGILPKSTYYLKLVFLDKFGYDLRRVSSIRNGETRPFRDYLLHWEASRDVFYVQRFVNVVTSAARDTASTAANTRELTVEYHQFEANIDISPDVFELSSTPVPDGTLFFDKRSNVEGGPKRLRYEAGRLVPLQP